MSLRVGPANSRLDVTADWTVNEDPAKGQVRFLVAAVPQKSADGTVYTDYFPKAELGAPGEKPTSVTFSLAEADPHSIRKMVVISVPDGAGCADQLRQLRRADLAQTDTPCPGQEWSYASEGFDVAKP